VVGRTVIPVIIGGILVQLNFVIERIMASGLPEGSISSLDFGYKLMRMPFEIFAVAIATVVFPSITGLFIAGEGSRLREVFVSSLRMIAFITIPATVILIIVRVPLIRALFQRGEFNAVSTRMTATALLYYSFGLFFHAANYILIRTYYAFKDFLTPLKLAAVTIGLYILFNSILIRYLDHGGLALGSSLAAVCYSVMLLRVLQKKMRNLGRIDLSGSFLKIIAASFVMGLALLLVDRIGLDPPVAKIAFLLGVGVFSYGVACFFFRVEEAGKLWKMGRQFIMKRVNLL
jgi:putative peptidoglycan lipid II flippase